MTTPLLRVDELTVSFSLGRWWRRDDSVFALDKVSFELQPGEIFGVMGRNGCGKTTLLRVLAGATQATSGRVEELAPKPLSKALLSIGFGFDRYLTGRENALLSAMLQGQSRGNAEAMLDSIKDFSELGRFFDQPVYRYSSGMRSKLGFATAMTLDVDLLLIDETLSVGDVGFRDKAKRSMQEQMKKSRAVVFVSHQASQVRQICNQAIWLEQGTVRAAGSTGEVAEQYEVFMQNQKRAAPTASSSQE